MVCEKCKYEGEYAEKFSRKLCKICYNFSPDNKEDFNQYLNEKIDWKVIETFRKYKSNKLKQGMENKAKQGNVMSRAAFGYIIEKKKLIPDPQKKLIVQKIFMDFLEKNISLNQLAKSNNFSVNGIKKILKNFTYIGKVKFAGQISQGKHESLISPELFNKVQSKLETLGLSK